MADIIYTYKNEVYANITNKCDCACTFCIRSQKDAIGDATSLWHTVDPTYDEIIAAIDAFDFTGYEEFVFCGYGEPTCALDILEKTAKYVKEKYKLPIRVNTNGLGNLYHGRDGYECLYDDCCRRPDRCGQQICHATADSCGCHCIRPWKEARCDIDKAVAKMNISAILSDRNVTYICCENSNHGCHEGSKGELFNL